MVKKSSLIHASELSTYQHSSTRTVAIRRTAWATAVTFLMMLIEIVVGELSGSMALLADGWHMATHVLALGLSCVAFYLSRRFSTDRRFVFGPSKIEALASFSSALLLVAVGLWMILESTARLLVPVQVEFSTALIVAVVGLWVNLICVLLLHQKAAVSVSESESGASVSNCGKQNGEDSSAAIEEVAIDQPRRGLLSKANFLDRHPPTPSENLNLKAAYLHVLSDAVTSLLAIVALIVGHLTGISQLDTVVGFVGAALVLLWSKSLLKQSLVWLLDMRSAPDLEETVRQRLAKVSKIIPKNTQAKQSKGLSSGKGSASSTKDKKTEPLANLLTTSWADVYLEVLDIKLWMLASGRYGLIVVLSEATQFQLSWCREQLRDIPQLDFVAIEVFLKPAEV